jgi:hypothetical protein
MSTSMTRLIGLLAMALLLAPLPARATDEALTLRDVIELHRSGLGDDLLIAVIDADAGGVTLSYADIQDLKSDGLSERVIAALVRSGGRRTASAPGDAPAPVVHVTQQVTTWAPTVIAPTIVVVPPPASDGRHERRQREAATPPAATWVTRRDDGKNVAATGEIRTGRPAATWVTPRDPKPREPAERATPTPKSR